MSEAASTTANFLKQIKDLSGESKKHRLKAVENRARAEKAEAALTAAQSELAALKTRADAAPSELQRENEQLRGEVRTHKHREVFNQSALAAGVRPEAVPDLWTVSGYKAETDAPDAKAIKAAVDEAVKSRPWLAAAPANAGKEGDETPAEGETPPAGPGVGRGGSVKLAGRFVVTAANLRDAEWMRVNQKAMAEANQTGSLLMQP